MPDLIGLCLIQNPHISNLSLSSVVIETFWQQLSIFNSCLSWGY
ncbi:Uncharacterised protein [Suttonella ornithocola]|uniref:Uncharacterized protein n=1 Tax=Suttonella ornithocola TaxID=279832 RepID=A0A380MP02_9GAMM|nr:Uncharacterised protein [Suttonella ornithocola]SUO97367.1 Uncharacterised protein [Suttonella ornithocola]